MTSTKESVVHLALTGTAESHSRTRLKTRDLTNVSDEPEERGGTNEGFAPTELFNASLIASTSVISQKLAKKHDINLVDCDFALDASFNRSGVMLQTAVELPFEEMILTINVTTDATDDDIQLLERELSKYCPVSTMVLAAGTRLKRVWNVTRPGGQ